MEYMCETSMYCLKPVDSTDRSLALEHQMYFNFFPQLFMICSRLKSGGLLYALLIWVCVSVAPLNAAGLGALTLHSSLGQHLDAEIDITGAAAGDFETMQVVMAPSEIFEQMGIPVPSVLQHIRFDIQSEPKDRARVKLSSVMPIREPFLNLVVELTWAQGTYLREYTFLLDPVLTHRSDTLDAGGSSDAAVVGNANDQINEFASASADDEEMIFVDAIETEPEQISGSAGYVVLVRRGATLLDIAKEHTPEYLSTEQVAMAIYDTNPSAFYGSVHQLKRGAELVIPDFDQVQLKSLATARKNLGTSSRVQNRHTMAKHDASVNNSSEVSSVESNDSELLLAASGADGASETGVTMENAGRSALVASQSMGTMHRPEAAPSASALRNLIAELRKAMVGLGTELQLKTTQLDEISERVDQLQQRQAISTSSGPDTRAGVVGASAALKVVPDVQASSTLTKLTKQISQPSVTTGENKVSDLAATSPAASASAHSALSDSADQSIEPISMLDQSQLDSPTLVKQPTQNQKSTQSLSVDQINLQKQNETVAVESTTENEGGALAWFFDDSQSQVVGNRIRDAGLLSLALLLGFILVRKALTSVRMVDVELQKGVVNADSIALDLTTHPVEAGATSDVVNPLSAIEYFREQLTSEQRREHALRDSLSDDPHRQDLRLELLQVYHERGAVEMFGQTAREMYNQTKGKNPEWHAVIEMGLALDADMSFYSEPADHGFELNEDFAVSGSHVSSVPGGKSVAQRPAAQNSIARQASVSTRDNNAQVRLDEVVEQRATNDDVHPVDDGIAPNTVSDSTSEFEADGFDTNQLDIELDQAQDPANSEERNATALDQLSLDEAALDELVWNEPAADGLSERELMALSPDNAKQHIDDVHTEVDVDESAESDSIPDADTVTSSGADFDHSSVTNDLAAFKLSDDSTENVAPDSSKAEDASMVDDHNATGAFDASEPVQPISSWKESEVRLDLAVVYIDLGNTEGAMMLLNEVISSGDAAQVKVATGLLSKLQ